MNTATIAKICHQVNKIYCETLGDMSQPNWDDAPQWQKNSAIKGVQFHLDALKRGQHKTPEESHQSWLEQKRDEGWKYGPVKDAGKLEHPCFVAYEELSAEQRVKDYLFSKIVEAFYQSNAYTND